MIWFMLGHFVAFLVDLVVGTRPGDRDKDLQILVLRHQLRLLQRRHSRPPRLMRVEKLTLAVLTAALARLFTGPRHQLDQYLLICKPDTILRWHGELVRRKWTYRWTKRGGRPTIPVELEGRILRRHRMPPAPQRRRATTWAEFINSHRAQLLVCDCFTVETLFLKTLSALFCIEIGTRRVHLARCTNQPTAA